MEVFEESAKNQPLPSDKFNWKVSLYSHNKEQLWSSKLTDSYEAQNWLNWIYNCRPTVIVFGTEPPLPELVLPNQPHSCFDFSLKLD